MSSPVRYKSTADYVTAEIQRLILSGELTAGARIDQVELATQLDVSRHPVRQAIERLAERGFIDLSPHRSAVVAELSAADMEELYDIRVKLETFAVRQSWPKIIGNGSDRISAHFSRLQGTDPAEDIDAYMQANRDFHLSMYEDCGNRHLLRMIVMLFTLSERYQRTALRFSTRLTRSSEDHAQMMQAILDQNLEELARLIAHHNLGTQQTIREQII